MYVKWQPQQLCLTQVANAYILRIVAVACSHWLQLAPRWHSPSLDKTMLHYKCGVFWEIYQLGKLAQITRLFTVNGLRENCRLLQAHDCGAFGGLPNHYDLLDVKYPVNLSAVNFLDGCIHFDKQPITYVKIPLTEQMIHSYISFLIPSTE